jgi:hypothetical protein
MKVENEDEFLDKKESINRTLALEVADRCGAKVSDILLIANFQFELLAKVIECGRMESLRLPYLGIFLPVEYKVKKISEYAAFRRLKRQSDPESGGEVNTGVPGFN